MREFVLERPKNISEVHELLGKYGPKAVLKSGGTDLIIWLKKDVVKPEFVIDLSSVEELKGIFVENKNLVIGAMTTINDLLACEKAKKSFPALVQAGSLHSDPLIRNQATVAGNLCSAVPSGDMIPPLYCYDALVLIEGPDGKKTMKIDEFVTGPKKNALKRGEIVVSIKIPIPEEGSEGTYLKAMRRESLDIAQAAVCFVVLKRNTGKADPAYKVRSFRISFGAVSPVPLRAFEAETILDNSENLDRETVEKVVRAAMEKVSPITDVRASREYRLGITENLLREALAKGGGS